MAYIRFGINIKYEDWNNISEKGCSELSKTNW